MILYIVIAFSALDEKSNVECCHDQETIMGIFNKEREAKRCQTLIKEQKEFYHTIIEKITLNQLPEFKT